MLEASWRLAYPMLGEVGARMGPRSTKIAQDGSKEKTNSLQQRSWDRLGAKLGRISFSKSRPEAPGPEKVTATGVGRRQRRGPGRVRVGKSPPGLDFRI